MECGQRHRFVACGREEEFGRRARERDKSARTTSPHRPGMIHHLLSSLFTLSITHDELGIPLLGSYTSSIYYERWWKFHRTSQFLHVRELYQYSTISIHSNACITEQLSRLEVTWLVTKYYIGTHCVHTKRSIMVSHEAYKYAH